MWSQLVLYIYCCLCRCLYFILLINQGGGGGGGGGGGEESSKLLGMNMVDAKIGSIYLM